MAVEAGGAPGPGSGHGREPERRTSGLDVARSDDDVLEPIAGAVEAEPLPGEAAAENFQPLLGAREALGQGNAEAAKLVGRVAHPHAQLDAPAAQVVEHGE